MKTFTEEQILKVAVALWQGNSGNPNSDNIDKNPYACGVHDGILDVLSELGIKTNEEWIN